MPPPNSNAINELGQPIGFALPDWKMPSKPAQRVLEHRLARLEPIDPVRHTPSLFDAYAEDRTGAGWTYLPYGPFTSTAELRKWIDETCLGDDPMFFAIVDPKTNRALGVASYLRITPSSGSIEVGHIRYSPALQQTACATAAMYLMMAYAFDLGYRRYEWKCDALNAPSRRAAERLGFTYEGTFRQATVYRERNRDTAWYSIIDTEWPQLREIYQAWLTPENFDVSGIQRKSLGELQNSFLC